MIDVEKWEKASDEMKMQAAEVVKGVMKENTLTKQDNQLLREFLLGKAKGERNE